MQHFLFIKLKVKDWAEILGMSPQGISNLKYKVNKPNIKRPYKKLTIEHIERATKYVNEKLGSETISMAWWDNKRLFPIKNAAPTKTPHFKATNRRLKIDRIIFIVSELKRKGIDRKDLAKDLSMQKNNFDTMISDSSRVTRKFIWLLVDKYGVSLEYIEKGDCSIFKY